MMLISFTYLAAVALSINAIAPSLNAMSSGGRSFDRELLRKYFKCPACQPADCQIPDGYPGCELVLEPGVCACCLMCAKRVGDLCGLGSGRCGKGLSCRPVPGDPDPLGAILSGNAVCV